MAPVLAASSAPAAIAAPRVPRPRDLLRLLKPLTWFAPVWAFGCGALSAHPDPHGAHVLWRVAGGAALAGPLVCATSQAVNDWFDRAVDAINEPDRPIPSGRVPGRWGLGLALAWTGLSLAWGAMLGHALFVATLCGLALAWAYSAPPLRLKRDGWIGNLAVGLCYEGLPWISGALLIGGAMPTSLVWTLALLYSLGAHGIMTLNDFKSIEGDRASGIASLPARYGAKAASRLAIAVIVAAQIGVCAVLLAYHDPLCALIVGAFAVGQAWLGRTLLADPRGRAAWFNATGTSLYVLGMVAAAIAARMT